MSRQSNHRTSPHNLFTKFAGCLFIFTAILIWGWHTNHEQRKLRHPPVLEMLSEDENAHDIATMTEFAPDQTPLFLPRQYVKILRSEQGE